MWVLWNCDYTLPQVAKWTGNWKNNLYYSGVPNATVKIFVGKEGDGKGWDVGSSNQHYGRLKQENCKFEPSLGNLASELIGS